MKGDFIFEKYRICNFGDLLVRLGLAGGIITYNLVGKDLHMSTWLFGWIFSIVTLAVVGWDKSLWLCHFILLNCYIIELAETFVNQQRIMFPV